MLGRLNMFVGSGRDICWSRRSWSNVCSGPLFGVDTVLEGAEILHEYNRSVVIAIHCCLQSVRSFQDEAGVIYEQLRDLLLEFVDRSGLWHFGVCSCKQIRGLAMPWYLSFASQWAHGPECALVWALFQCFGVRNGCSMLNPLKIVSHIHVVMFREQNPAS